MLKYVLFVLIFIRNTSEVEELYDSPNTFDAVFHADEKAVTVLDIKNLTGDVGYNLYPWLGRVVATAIEKQPTRCTAACIKPKIFLNAARCVLGLTVGMACVVYDQTMMKIKAIVISDQEKHSKQFFDDCALIVVNAENYLGDWPTVPLLDVNRTDDDFKWFSKLNYENTEIQHKVISWRVRFPDRQVSYEPRLYEMKIFVGIDFCHELITENTEDDLPLPRYYVPCAVYCPKNLRGDCFEYQSFIKIEGSLVYNFEAKHILGVISWGNYHEPSNDDDEVKNKPIGIAIPNSKSYYEVLQCAMHIAALKDSTPHVPDFYQKYCDEKSLEAKAG